MKKNIEDYLPYYLGCKIAHPKSQNGDTWTLTVSDLTDAAEWLQKGHRPILRPLSDLTEEEAAEVAVISYKADAFKVKDTAVMLGRYLVKERKFENAFEVTHHLLSKHFDVFELIEAGLAIDKTTM
jgi:hypothetical protein